MADEEGLDEIYALADAEASASLDVLSGADKIAGLFGDDDLTENQESDSEDSEDQDDNEEGDDPLSGDSDSDDDEASDEDSEDELDADDEEDDEDSGETSDDTDDEDLTHLDLSESVLGSLVEVKINGEVKEVPLREALAGYQRQQAFTAKTQELAKQRKAVQDEIAGKQAERQKYVQGLERLKIAMNSILPEEPDWATVKAEDPTGYPDKFQAYQAHKAQMAEVEAEQERVLLETTTEAGAAKETRLEEERESLILAVPEWEDTEVFKREGEAIFQYLQESFGYTVEEFNAIEDHRALLLLRKAMKYDELTQKGKEIREKAKKVNKTPNLKPGGSESASEKKGKKKDRTSKAARSRFSKSGHVRDAAKVMEDFIE